MLKNIYLHIHKCMRLFIYSFFFFFEVYLYTYIKGKSHNC